MTNPNLSIIIPMREGVQKSWLQELLKIQGSIKINRRYVLAEIILLRQFPGFEYIWNLTIFDRGGIFMVWFPKDTLRKLTQRLGLKKPSS